VCHRVKLYKIMSFPLRGIVFNKKCYNMSLTSAGGRLVLLLRGDW